MSHAAFLYASRDFKYKKAIMENQVVFYSNELIEFIKLNDISAEEIITINPEELLNFNSFNWRIMAEVLTISKFEELQ